MVGCYNALMARPLVARPAAGVARAAVTVALVAWALGRFLVMRDMGRRILEIGLTLAVTWLACALLTSGQARSDAGPVQAPVGQGPVVASHIEIGRAARLAPAVHLSLPLSACADQGADNQT